MIIGDGTMTTIEWALTAESERQRVTAHNISNVNTPGFHSSRLDFEQSLANALDASSNHTATIDTHAANTPQNINGNDVSIEDETMILEKSSIHYDALVQAMNFKFAAMRSAIGR
jgi:flagellar basal-body rod protein FlgB